jgi:hypothetical protein
MDLSPLRALVRNVNFQTHGTDITVDVDPEPIATRGIWITPDDDDYPAGTDLRRRERAYVLAVPLLEVPHGTIVHAPLPTFAPADFSPATIPGEILRWRVDGFAAVRRDHIQIRVVLAPEETT